MKKIVILFSLCFTCIMLTSCDPHWFHYQQETLEETVSEVELIIYENPRARKINTFVPIIEPRIKNFDFKKVEVLEALDAEGIDDFIIGVSDLSLSSHWIHSNSPFGVSIRIIYDNGDFDVMSFDYGGDRMSFLAKYNSSGTVKDFIGVISESQNDYIDFVNNHFMTQIEQAPTQK